MIIGIQGTKSFDDYSIFMRAMGTALLHLGENDKEIHLYSAGPARINSFAMEFTNVTERSMKARGKRIKLIYVPTSWLVKNMNKVGYFAFFSKPKEPTPDIIDRAEEHGVDVGIYRY